MKAVLRAILAAAVVWLVYFLRGNVCLRLYPVVISAAALAVFAVSAFRTPMVEVVARRRYGPLDADKTEYCRKLNNCWIAFLTVHLAVTVASVFMSPGFWAFYNGLFAYVLFGAMFLGEWLYRRKREGRKK